MVYIIGSLMIVVADYITKRLAQVHLAGNASKELIKNVFSLTYVENRGAAFGILQDSRSVFIVLTAVILAAVLYAAVKYKNKPRVLNIGLSFLVGGAVGNMIDRIFLGYVVDFFDFCLIGFPVFNVADIFVCIGAVLTAWFFITYDEKKQKGSE